MTSTINVLWVAEGDSYSELMESSRSETLIFHMATFSNAARVAVRTVPDVILLVDSLAPTRALELCSHLSVTGGHLVAILSARRKEETILQAFEAGASEYLVAPLHEEELRARLRTLARRLGAGRNGSTAPDLIQIGELRIAPGERRVYLGARPLELTATEFSLLYCLARDAGRPVTHSRLLASVWGPQYQECRNYLRLYIRYLRTKLEPDPEKPQIIVNEWGIGYRLNVPVQIAT